MNPRDLLFRFGEEVLAALLERMVEPAAHVGLLDEEIADESLPPHVDRHAFRSPAVGTAMKAVSITFLSGQGRSRNSCLLL